MDGGEEGKRLPDGGWYCVSPWHLRWDDENYYLIAYDAEADRVKHYRVDKMKRITLLGAPVGAGADGSV